MKKNVMRVCVFAVCMNIFTGCMSTGTKNEEIVYTEIDGNQAKSENKKQTEPEQKTETPLEKFKRLYKADYEKLVVGNDNKVTIESIEAVLQPQDINSINEIKNVKLNEFGKPYYFKMRAIYKGYDANTEEVRLQNLKQKKTSVTDTAMKVAFGIDSAIYSVNITSSSVSTLPNEANAIATFYFIVTNLSDIDDIKENEIFIRFVRDIEKPRLNPANFIVASGMHYITVEDAHSPTQEEVMSAYFFGGTMGNSSSDVFDPVVYLPADLMDARAVMNKKDYLKDYTLPTVKVKYVSEVLFLGQYNTTITVSTVDNVLAERMTFIGRTSSIKRGEKIRVYYTIAKDPLEKWEIQAIERL